MPQHASFQMESKHSKRHNAHAQHFMQCFILLPADAYDGMKSHTGMKRLQESLFKPITQQMRQWIKAYSVTLIIHNL
jgi:hypothetical protein